jgi:vancomycin resistance protein YoaR
MKVFILAVALAAALTTISLGWQGLPLVLAGRLVPNLSLDGQSLAGLNRPDLLKVLAVVNQRLQSRSLPLAFRSHAVSRSLGELGVQLDVDRTAAALLKTNSLTDLYLIINEEQLNQQIKQDFHEHINLPQNATLDFTPTGQLNLVPSASGEALDLLSFEQQLRQVIYRQEWQSTLNLQVISTAPSVQTNEVAAATTLAQRLLTQGVTLQAAGHEWRLSPATLRSLLKFVPQPDPEQPTNQILGISLESDALSSYLATSLVPEINRPPQNARFARVGDQVEQISAGLNGQTLDLPGSVAAINQALAAGQTQAALSLQVLEPSVVGNRAFTQDKFTTLLARGESDFAGSPANRRHNIAVGADRYHGLLIPPGAEFSFNDFLGPVTAAAGYKPELVIKHDKTIPEYGGGLCQVSTTIFRAATHAGLKITERRNHAYAVSYYGKPGFDATIYPGATDLKFVNDTPDYLLLQTILQGTQLSVELWGESDGRQVAVTGPQTYDAEANGAVKALLRRTVTRDGQVVSEDTFYSRYRSPALFPKLAFPG